MTESTDFNIEEMRRTSTVDGWKHLATCHAAYHLTLISEGVQPDAALQLSLQYQYLAVQMYLEEKIDRREDE